MCACICDQGDDIRQQRRVPNFPFFLVARVVAGKEKKRKLHKGIQILPPFLPYDLILIAKREEEKKQENVSDDADTLSTSSPSLSCVLVAEAKWSVYMC